MVEVPRELLIPAAGYLVVDGIVSIIVHPESTLVEQAFRAFRSVTGVILMLSAR